MPRVPGSVINQHNNNNNNNNDLNRMQQHIIARLGQFNPHGLFQDKRDVCSYTQSIMIFLTCMPHYVTPISVDQSDVRPTGD